MVVVRGGKERETRGSRFRRTWLLFPSDVIIIVLSTILSFELRFSWDIPTSYHTSFLFFVILRLFIYPVFYFSFRMYSRVWRHASVKDMEAVLISTALGATIVKVVDLLVPQVTLPQSVWLSSFLLTLTGVSGTRFLWRVVGSRIASNTVKPETPSRRIHTLVFGAGAAGSLLAREIHRTQKSWKVVGFIDDNREKIGLMLNGKRILGTREDIASVIDKQKVDQILVAIPSMSRQELRELVDSLGIHRLPILITPPITRWMVHNANLFAQVKPVEVEDLLGRDPHPINVLKVGTYLTGATVLVTGAGGSIGSEICRQVAAVNPAHVVLLGRGENSIFEVQYELKTQYPDLKLSFVIGDIRDRVKMEQVFAQYQPDVVFHAAAHKHVPLMEEHPDEAYVNNILGTRQVALLAAQHGVSRFILISSDKAVRPTNVMGASKRVAEMVLQDLALTQKGTCFVTVRFGNVLGSRGSVIRVFRRQIESGGPVTVTDERMIRYFMTIPEAVRLVIEAGAVGDSGEVFLLDMGDPVRIYDLAERMIRLSGFEPGVDIPIKITGIRPGEKLFEELSREGTDSVNVDGHDGIWSMQCPIMPDGLFVRTLAELQELYETREHDQLRDAIKALAWWEPSVEQEVAVGLQ